MDKHERIGYWVAMAERHGTMRVIVFLLDLIDELKAKGKTAVLAQDGDDGLNEWYQK